jgi:Arc/MetJ-type ribon-helix-helix transcriptional regulator
MPIILRPEHEQLVAEALRSGAYQSPDEVIKRALELLHERVTGRAARLQLIRAHSSP